MRKFFVILGFFAFTFNVNADYAPIDIQIAEGEEYQIDQIVASQVIDQTGWDGTYILTGGVSRVYIDYLPRDGFVLDYGSSHIAFLQKAVYRQDYGGWVLVEDTTQRFNSPYDAYEYYLQHTGNYNDFSQGVYFFPISIYQDDVGEYLDVSQVLGYLYTRQSDNFQSQSSMSELAKKSNTAELLNKGSFLKYSQVPINGVRITITNSQGQATSQFDTNIVVKLDQILQQVTRIKNDTSTIVSELMFLANAFGFDGSVGSSTSNLAEFLGQWRTADGVWQGEIFDVITNLANQADYTDYLKLMVDTSGNPTNVAPFVWLNKTFTKLLGSLGTFGTYQGLLNNSQANFLYGSEYRSAFNHLLRDMVDNYLQNNSSVSALGLLFDFQNLYLNMGSQFQEAIRQTNIVNAVSLGRDWLNLATNDISSLPYWLNQQDYSPVGGTNNASFTRFDVITNQYAHIGLTGSGQQANSTETWNYFKRLEMLLAALVYKQTDYEGKIDPHESGNNASVSSSVATGEDQINTSLTAVKDALTLSTIGNAKNNIVSLFQTATSAFDVNGSKRVINVMETDVATGNESAGVTVNVDFTQGELGDFADFVHHLFGFAWGFGSLFIFWRVCKFCWDMGYKVVKFHYSLCRKFLGI